MSTVHMTGAAAAELGNILAYSVEPNDTVTVSEIKRGDAALVELQIAVHKYVIDSRGNTTRF